MSQIMSQARSWRGREVQTYRHRNHAAYLLFTVFSEKKGGKTKKMVGKMQEPWHCPFHWLKGRNLPPIHSRGKLLQAVPRLQLLVCHYSWFGAQNANTNAAFASSSVFIPF